jgi:hypothetical protein
MKVWHISRQRHAATAFSGEGSRIASGRWNAVGVQVVYTSLSLSLAVVEVFVSLDVAEDPGTLYRLRQRYRSQKRMWYASSSLSFRRTGGELVKPNFSGSAGIG